MSDRDRCETCIRVSQGLGEAGSGRQRRRASRELSQSQTSTSAARQEQVCVGLSGASMRGVGGPLPSLLIGNTPLPSVVL